MAKIKRKLYDEATKACDILASAMTKKVSDGNTSKILFIYFMKILKKSNLQNSFFIR